MAIGTFTITCDLSTFALTERAGGYGKLVVRATPGYAPVPAEPKSLVEMDAVSIANDGTASIDLAAIDGVTYTVSTSPKSLFTPFSFAALAAGETRDLSELMPVPAPSSLTPYVRGASAYEVAVADGFVGTEADWLASLEGPQGLKGDTGDTGPANSLAIGTVTTGAAGSSASATITGTAPSQTLDLTIPQGIEGTPTAYELRGTGSPLGVVSAPVGTYYTDTAGTNGAWRWLKKSGAGNTGWAVVTGDTGWRNFGSELVNGFTAAATCLIRRTGDNIYFLGRLNATAATSNVYWTIPTGFRYQGGSFTIPVNSGTIILRASPSFTAETASRSATFDFMWQWATVEQWPTTLPGIAG